MTASRFPVLVSRRLPIALAALVLAGCAASPPARFYAFSAPPPAAVERAAYEVVVGPVSVPEFVDRPQMVLRVAPNRVALAEQARWAEPLGPAIGRLLAGEIGQKLADTRVVAYPQDAGPEAWRVVIDVRAFESEPGRRVAIDMVWAVRRAGSRDDQVTGGRRVEEAVSGSDPGDLVAAHERALRTLGDAIAASLRGVVGRG